MRMTLSRQSHTVSVYDARADAVELRHEQPAIR
jgi:hypothetical protein